MVIDVPADEGLLTTAELARALRVSRRTVARYAERGHLVPALVLPSGQYRWNLDDVRRQLRDRRERGEET